MYENPFTVKDQFSQAMREMKFGDFDVQWLHLPGHCPGSSMIYLKDENIIFLEMYCLKGQLTL